MVGFDRYKHTDMVWVNHTDTYTDTDIVLLNHIHTDTDIERKNFIKKYKVHTFSFSLISHVWELYEPTCIVTIRMVTM